MKKEIGDAGLKINVIGDPVLQRFVGSNPTSRTLTRNYLATTGIEPDMKHSSLGQIYQDNSIKIIIVI